MEVIVGLIVMVLVALLCLAPTWLLMMAYNYLAVLTGNPNWEIPITFLSVVCVAVIITVIGSIFKSRK